MREYIEKMGLTPIDSSIYDRIPLWKSWYCGKNKDFHYYRAFNGRKYVKCERASLGMAKRVCEDWANLLLNEKVEITCENEKDTAMITKVLADSNFRVLGNRLAELTFALGTGAFAEYISGGIIRVDCITADKIFPLAFEHGRITECAFASEKTVGNKKCIYVQAHTRNKDGTYKITNRMFAPNKEPLPLPDGMIADIDTHGTVPLFQIITPNVANSAEIGSPFGMPVFADAIDILMGIDLVYDSYCNEFRLGKKRIFVPLGMAQIMDDSGIFKPVFDDNDTVFYGINDENGNKIVESNMSLRSAEHKESLQQQLDLLSDRVGLGNGRYRIEKNSVKTATEVISEQSSLYQNLRKHELVMSEALIGLSRAVLFLLGRDSSGEIKVDFDDSIIRDTDADFTKNIQLVSAGLMLPYEFRMWWYNETEEQAKAALAESVPDDDGGGDE